jgi:hypothetical protein
VQEFSITQLEKVPYVAYTPPLKTPLVALIFPEISTPFALILPLFNNVKPTPG